MTWNLKYKRLKRSGKLQMAPLAIIRIKMDMKVKKRRDGKIIGIHYLPKQFQAKKEK